jgi:hypothetical protein
MLSLFEQPVAAFIDVLRLRRFVELFGMARMLAGLASFAVSLFIAVLAVRRAKLMRRSRSISAPSSFKGFPYGLAWAALGLIPVWFVLQSMAFPIGSGLVVVNAFLAFVLTELPDFRGSRQDATAGSVNQVPVPTAAATRPIWTFLALAFPALGGGVLVLFQTAFEGASLGTLVVGFMALTVSCVLGLAATVIAVVRKERWIPAQVIGFVLNFSVTGALGLGLLAEVFGFG